MNTKYVVVDEFNIDSEVMREAGEIIKKGGLVAFPTETVYGLGGDGLNSESSKKIYSAKGRPSDNPLIVHISKWEDLEKIVDHIPDAAYRLSRAFWPGPLTMIFNKSQLVPKETTGGLNTVAVRMPSDKIARAFIEAAGGYIAAPSANLSGKPSPTRGKYVLEDMDGRIDMIIDGGDSLVGLESTIVDLTEEKPVILRPGFITEKMLEEVLNEEVKTDPAIIDINSDKKPKAPGMKYRHYAPKGSLCIVEGSQKEVFLKITELLTEARKDGKKTGVIASEETIGEYRADSVKSLGARNDESQAAHLLFRILREFDDEDVEVIFSESFEGDGVAKATMNRLLKAAGMKIIRV